MSSVEMKKRRYGLVVLAILAAWTLFAFFFSTQLYLNIIYHGRSLPFFNILVPWLACGYLWAALTPVTLWLARRFPARERSDSAARRSASSVWRTDIAAAISCV
jgi:hypothetical protein